MNPFGKLPPFVIGAAAILSGVAFLGAARVLFEAIVWIEGAVK